MFESFHERVWSDWFGGTSFLPLVELFSCCYKHLPWRFGIDRHCWGTTTRNSVMIPSIPFSAQCEKDSSRVAIMRGAYAVSAHCMLFVLGMRSRAPLAFDRVQGRVEIISMSSTYLHTCIERTIHIPAMQMLRLRETALRAFDPVLYVPHT